MFESCDQYIQCASASVVSCPDPTLSEGKGIWTGQGKEFERSNQIADTTISNIPTRVLRQLHALEYEYTCTYTVWMVVVVVHSLSPGKK